MWKLDSDEKIMFYYINQDTHQLVKKVVNEESEPTSFHLNIICKAFGFPPGGTINFSLSNLIERLNSSLDWDVSTGESPNEFHFYQEISTQATVAEYEKEVQDLMISLTLTNKDVGFDIVSSSTQPVYKRNPSIKKIGLATYSPSYSKSNMSFSDRGRLAARAIQLAKTSNSQAAALAILWETLKECFFDKSKQSGVFSKEEIGKLINCAELGFSSKDKGEFVKRELRKLKTPNQNKIIAQEIVKKSGWELEDTYRKIVNARDARGRLVHNSENIKDFMVHFEFMSESLKLLLN